MIEKYEKINKIVKDEKHLPNKKETPSFFD